jgi:acylphosphatase
VPAFRYLVRGVVQGVGYRYFVLRQAMTLGLGGYARNCGDGSVEVMAEGEASALEELESRLRVGPAASEVTTLEREAIEPRGSSDFRIR